MIVHLVDYLNYTVHSPRVPTPLVRTIVWGNGIYIAGPPAEDETPQYFECTAFVCSDTRPTSGFNRTLLELELGDEPATETDEG